MLCSMDKTFFDQLVKNNLWTYDSISKVAIGQRDYFATGCLLDYNWFSDYCNIIEIDLSKQKRLDADIKAIQQIEFTGNLERVRNANTIQGTVKVF